MTFTTAVLTAAIRPGIASLPLSTPPGGSRSTYACTAALGNSPYRLWRIARLLTTRAQPPQPPGTVPDAQNASHHGVSSAQALPLRSGSPTAALYGSGASLSHVFSLQPQLEHLFQESHKQGLRRRLQVLLSRLPNEGLADCAVQPGLPPASTLSPLDLDHLLLLEEGDLLEAATDCGVMRMMMPETSSAPHAGSPGGPGKEELALALHDVVLRYSREEDAGSDGRGAASPSGSPARRAAANWQPVADGLRGEGGAATEGVRRLADSLWRESRLDALRQSLNAQGSEPGTSQSKPAGLPQAASSRPAAELPPQHPYAPPPDEATARRQLERTLAGLLARLRRGRPRRAVPPPDCGSPALLRLLPREQILEVCLECGVTPPASAPHNELVQALAGLVALARGWPLPEASAHAPHEGPGLPVQRDDVMLVEEGPTASELAARALASSETAAQAAVGGEGDPLPANVQQDVRRIGVAAATRAMLFTLVTPTQVARWLLAARARDITHAQHSAAVSGGAAGEQLVVATAVSSQHAAACAQAVAWHVSQVVAAVRESAPPGSWAAAAAAAWSPPRTVGADTLSDWVAVDPAPGLPVHVLTPPASAYYDLLGKFVRRAQRGVVAPTGSAAVHEPLTVTVTSFRAPAPAQPSLTLDTITADEAHNGAQPGVQGAEPSMVASVAGAAAVVPAGLPAPTWEQALAVGLHAAGAREREVVGGRGRAQAARNRAGDGSRQPGTSGGRGVRVHDTGRPRAAQRAAAPPGRINAARSSSQAASRPGAAGMKLRKGPPLFPLRDR